MSQTKGFKVFILSVHRVYKAEWESLIINSGHQVALNPEEADVAICMNHNVPFKQNNKKWELMKELSIPLIMGRSSPVSHNRILLDKAVALGVKHHLIASKKLHQLTASEMKKNGFSDKGIYYIPKCHDALTRELLQDDTMLGMDKPVENPESLSKIITLINHYGQNEGDKFQEYKQVESVIPDVYYYGKDSPHGFVNATETLSQSKFLLHLKGKGCVDNSPIQAIAMGVPVLTTEDSIKNTLNDEAVVHKVSSYIAKDVEELIEFLRNCSVDQYLKLRKSTWEFGERFRHWPSKTLHDFNELLQDAVETGTFPSEVDANVAAYKASKGQS